MLRGELAGLRARRDDDIAVLHAELYDDVETRVRSDARPWRPLPPRESPYRVDGKPEHAAFSAVELASGELAGEAVLWQIDQYNRAAHIGLALRPAFRGRGLGADIVRVLCRYGFAIRGLHRLQLETLADNEAMIRVAGQVGFVREGIRRGSEWVDGAFADEVTFGLLEAEWTGATTATASH